MTATEPPIETTAAALGFWSGIATAICAVGFLAANLALPTPAWRGMAAYVSAFHHAQMLWMIPTLILAPAYLLLMTCVHSIAGDGKKLLGEVAVVFSAIYAGLASTNYFIQLIAVRPLLLRGEASGLEFLAMANPNGLFIALEGLGYLFQEIGMLFAAFIFFGGGLKRAIRYCLLGAGFGCWPLAAILVLILPTAILSPFGSLGVVSVGTDLWAIFTALSGILLAIRFRRDVAWKSVGPGPTGSL